MLKGWQRVKVSTVCFEAVQDFLSGGLLLFSVVLVSAEQQRESALCLPISTPPRTSLHPCKIIYQISQDNRPASSRFPITYAKIKDVC